MLQSSILLCSILPSPCTPKGRGNGFPRHPFLSGYAGRFPSEYADIVAQVYHNAGSPAAWLGSLCPFILEHYGNPYVKALVKYHS